MPYAPWVFAILTKLPLEDPTLTYNDAFEAIAGGPIDWALVDDFLDAATAAGVEWLDPWFVHPYRKKPEGALIRYSHGDGTESLWTGVHIAHHKPSTATLTWGDAISGTLTSMVALSKGVATIRRSPRGPVSFPASQLEPEQDSDENYGIDSAESLHEIGPDHEETSANGEAFKEHISKFGEPVTSQDTEKRRHGEWVHTILNHLGEDPEAPFEDEIGWAFIADFFDAARECEIEGLTSWEVWPYRNDSVLALVRHVGYDDNEETEEVLQWERVDIRGHTPNASSPTWGDVVVHTVDSVTDLLPNRPVAHTPVAADDSQSPERNEQRQPAGAEYINRLLSYRREAAALSNQVRLSRMARYLIASSVLTALVSLVGAIAVNAATWRLVNMKPYNIAGCALLAVLSIAFTIGIQIHNRLPKVEGQKRRSLVELKLELDLLEERRVLEAAQGARSSKERQHSYRESIPLEIDRLRRETRRYRRVHNFFQWGLFSASVAISVTTAIYDPPQPGKGILITLGAFVSFTTAITGYFKFRERAFNLQQTADAIEQHATAYDLAISPYQQEDEEANLERLAETIELLRVEQRKREQQLEQPHQGQHEVI
ncbi:DUF4231 domain-containing protein [Streptomyces sp. NPDC060187]|uniref:DUF4231 domain-containing protein n=1 Tax=Streptomyces sp. NPDC060187 TaxID=3347067 RepID=UPI00364A21F9